MSSRRITLMLTLHVSQAYNSTWLTKRQCTRFYIPSKIPGWYYKCFNAAFASWALGIPVLTFTTVLSLLVKQPPMCMKCSVTARPSPSSIKFGTPKTLANGLTENAISWVGPTTQDDGSGLDSKTWARSDKIHRTRWIKQSSTKTIDEIMCK